MDQGSLAPTHGLSQLAASFVAFQSLGIRRTPFPTFAAPIVLPHVSGATGTCLQPSTRVDGITHSSLFVYSTFCSGSSTISVAPLRAIALMALNQFLFLFQHVKDRRASALYCGCGLVENNGFEPLTPCVQSRCSSQLS